MGRNWTVDNIGATGAGVGPMAAPPNFLAPTILYTNFTDLATAQPFLTPQNVLGGSQDQKTQTTYNWSLGIQHELARGLVMDVSYIGNALRHGYGQAIDFNAVQPLTTWNPKDGANPKFRDPTSSGFYSTNLIRSQVGYAGYGQIPLWTYVGTNNYNSLQVQLNRRIGRLQWNSNYTWSRTITYLLNPTLSPYSQWIDTKLTKNVANRAHAVNFNMGYDVPYFNRLGSNMLAKAVLDGWHINGDGAIYSGTPYTVGCSAQNAPPGYWTGTPTGGIPFRCQMGNQTYLPEGQFASKTEDPRLQVPFNAANFTLPGIDSLGIGNTPPTIAYGPGVFNLDFSLAKVFKIRESMGLEFRVETFNTLNHFNPGNPNTSLNYNVATGAQTNASFGTIQSAQVQARRSVMSLRAKF